MTKSNDILSKVILNMKYDTKKTLVENRNSILIEQKTYKKGNFYYVEDSGTTYSYDPKNKTWYITKGTNLRPIEKYDLEGKFDKTSNELIIKLNNILKKSGLMNTTVSVKWKDTNEGKRVIGDLVKLGIKLTYDPISMNHAYAMAAIESTKKLTDLISSKIKGSIWNSYSICVSKVGGNCPSDRYAKFNTFNIQMANEVNNYPENVNGIKPPFFMILQNFYFDYGKIYEDLKNTFKYDKNAFKSDMFPDGWWNWFTTYFGTDNLNNIKTKVSKITYLNLPKVESKIKIGDTTSLLDILSDGHTLLDLASIAVLLLPPPIGIIASSTIDGINAMWYLNEGHPYLAALTAIGVFPGIKQTKFISSGVKMDTKLMKFVEDLTYTSKTEKLTQSKIDDIFAKHTKDLTDAEKLTFGKDLINISKNADKKILDELYKTINKWNEYTNYDKNLLKNIFKDEKNIKLLQKHNGNLDSVLKDLRQTLDRDQQISLCLQLGLYAVVSDLLPMIVPEELILEVYKTGLIGFQERVIGGGYDWDKTLEIFAVSNKTTDPKNYQQDISILELAWKNGWRPYTKKGNELVINPVPKKYQTESYKKFMKNLEDKHKKEMQKKTIYVVKGEDVDIPDDVEVVYVDSKEEAEFYGGWGSEGGEDDESVDYDAIDKYLNKK